MASVAENAQPSKEHSFCSPKNSSVLKKPNCQTQLRKEITTNTRVAGILPWLVVSTKLRTHASGKEQSIFFFFNADLPLIRCLLPPF